MIDRDCPVIETISRPLLQWAHLVFVVPPNPFSTYGNHAFSQQTWEGLLVLAQWLAPDG